MTADNLWMDMYKNMKLMSDICKVSPLPVLVREDNLLSSSNVTVGPVYLLCSQFYATAQNSAYFDLLQQSNFSILWASL